MFRTLRHADFPLMFSSRTTLLKMDKRAVIRAGNVHAGFGQMWISGLMNV